MTARGQRTTGRPSKLTPEVIAALSGAIAVGMPYELACRQAGISYRAFTDWRSGRFPASVKPALRHAFSQSLKRAEAEALYDALSVIKAASMGTAPPGAEWQAAAWFAERRCPEHFGRSRKSADSDPETG